MFHLVNYGSSDEEDGREESTNSPRTESQTEAETVGRRDDEGKSDLLVSAGSILNELPRPAALDGEEEEVIVKPSQKEIALRAKQPVLSKSNKIVFSLPAIESSDSEGDDDRPPSKKMRVDPKSSLLNSLPKPKFDTKKEAGKPLIPHSVAKKGTSTKATGEVFYEETDSEDSEGEVNFLMPTAVDESGFHESAKYKYQEDVGDSALDVSTIRETPRTAIPKEFLRDEQLRKIMMSQDIMEVNVGKHIEKYEVDRVKDFTKGPALGQNQKPTGQVNHQSKRKHQITFLAHQAKEREFDLKNQWAESRFNKQMTRNKYGF